MSINPTSYILQPCILVKDTKITSEACGNIFERFIVSGGNFNQGFGGPLNLPPVSSNAVDSLFGLSRGRSGPAPGFGGHQSGGQQDLLFGLGGKTGGGLDGLGSGRLGLGGLGLGDRLYSDQKQNHLGQHLQDNGFASKDWQVRQNSNEASNIFFPSHCKYFSC